MAIKYKIVALQSAPSSLAEEMVLLSVTIDDTQSNTFIPQ